MEQLQITKGRAVERVKPLSLLGYTKGVGKSEIENGVQYSAEFDNKQGMDLTTVISFSNIGIAVINVPEYTVAK